MIVPRRAFAMLLAIALLTTLPVLPAEAAVPATAVANGDWDDPATWGGTVPPLSSDTVNVTIPAGISVIIPGDLTVVMSDDSLLVHGFLFNGGTLDAGPGTYIENASDGEIWNLLGSFAIDGGSVGGTFLTSTLNNYGMLGTTGSFDQGAFTDILNTGTIRNSGDFVMHVRSELTNRGGTFENRGIFHTEHGFITGIFSIFRNEGGTVMNTASGVMNLGGSLFNSYRLGAGLVENRGTINLIGDSSHRGVISNGGTGEAIVDNFGIINMGRTMNNNGNSSQHLIRNRPGAEIRISSVDFRILSGRLLNEGMISIQAPSGKLENRAVVDNYGLIENGNVFDNVGSVIRARCDSSITGNAIQGNAPQDWCDSTPPVITVPASIVAEATSPSGAQVFYTVTVTDDKDPFPSPSCTPFSSSTFPLGSTTVTCTATDRVGNSSNEDFTITVVDTTAPALTVLGESSAVLVQNNPYVDGGATATDIVDGDLTSSIAVTDPVDVSTPGSYTVEYRVSDAAGNEATATRVVEVLTPAEATDRLITRVGSLDLEQSTRDELLRPLVQASRFLHDGRSSNDLSACRHLDVFRGAVRRHTGSGALTTDVASELTARTEEIKVGLGCR